MVPAVRAHRLSRRSADGLLALVLCVLGQLQVWGGWNAGGVGAGTAGDRGVRALLVLASTLPLAVRRSRPMSVLAVVCGAIVVEVVAVAPFVPFAGALLPMCIANYTVAAYGHRWRPAALGAVGVTELVMFARIPEERVPGELLFALFVALGTWVAGDVVRSRVSRADRAVGEARTLLAEQQALAAAALAQERTRIARELHDVIAHSVSLMGVQAGAARMLMDREPEAARAALCSIETAARESVGELQRLLAVLRGGDGTGVDRAPQPGLGELPRLVAQVRAAGLPVELSVSGEGALPRGVDLAAYRIVQEALTNALKHAAAAPTRVTVARGDAELCIEVCDRGPGATRSPNAAGHGLVGMRERVQLYGGTFEARPAPGGGFVVRARLPVAAVPG